MTHSKLFSSLILSCAILGGEVALADAPAGYYDSLEGLKGVALKKAVKKIAAKNFKAVPYGTKSSSDCTWKTFIDSDTRTIGSTRYWWDMYSDNNVPAPSYDSRGDMNIEHSVPNSWWGGDQQVYAYMDVFHLNPSDYEANGKKQNYPLGPISSLSWSNSGGFTSIGSPAPGTCGASNTVFEPADEYKGDFARAYFYIFTLYDDLAWQGSTGWMYDVLSDLTLRPWAYSMLLEWAEKDPVSQKEIDRNNAIQKHQGNRNPFIDCPNLARHIWGDLRNVPFHYGVSATPVPETSRGYWTPVKSAADLNEQDRYILVSTTNHVGMAFYAPTFATPYYLLECYKKPEFESSSSSSDILSVPEDIAVFSLAGRGSNWVIAVSDLNNTERGYLYSSEAKKMFLSQNPADEGTTVAISPSSSQTSIMFTSGAGYIKYNGTDSGKRFTTYASGLEAVMMYRFVPTDEGGNDGDENGETQKGLYEVTEDFALINSGLPTGSSNRPATAKNFTSSHTGINYTIMGCYVNNYEPPFYLLVNGKNNSGAFISFSFDDVCNEITMTTTAGCSTNQNSAVNVYAGDILLGTYKVNVQNSSVTVSIPEEMRSAGTVYKIESATDSYNQQFSAFSYLLGKDGEEPETSTVENIREGSQGPISVYTANGMLVSHNADPSLIENLPSGIYIVVTPSGSIKLKK